MRIFIVILCVFFVFNALATEDHTVWTSKYDIKHVYINGLKVDLFQKYKVQFSKGPQWGQDADFIADVVDEDFYERHTYWSESGYPEGECPNFTEEDFENAYEEGYGLAWESVKKVKGSQKTVYYLATYTISITSGSKSCTYKQSPEDKYVFINKLVDGKPIYLGYLSEIPQQK